MSPDNSKIGDSVFAVLSATDDEVRSLGRGVYQGQVKVPDGPMEGLENPCILLDAGETVWGFECWWGPAERWDEFLRDRKIVFVNKNDEPYDFSHLEKKR